MGNGDIRESGSAGAVGVAPPESLAQLRALAERDASRFAGEEPARRGRPAKPFRVGRVRQWSVRVGVAALLGVALWHLGSGGATSVASEVETDPLPDPVGLQSLSFEAVPTTGEHDESARQATDPLRISLERGVWRIRADAASRHDAARTLAELSGTHLPGGIEALRSTRPLDLQWEGRDLAHAWRAVIGNEASYALKCSQRHCMAWIVGAAPALEAHRSTKAPEVAPAAVASVQRTGRTSEGSETSAYD